MTGDYYDLGLKALSGIVDTLNAGLEQAPAYVIDLVSRYGIYVGTTNLIYAIIGICFAVVIYKLWKKITKVLDKYDESFVGITAFFRVIIAISIFTTCAKIGQAIKGYTLPEIVLIQDITGVGSRNNCK